MNVFNNKNVDEAKNNVNDNTFVTSLHRGVQPIQRPDTSKSGKLQAVNTLEAIDSTVQERSWTIDDIMSRYKFVGAYSVPTSLTSHHEIVSLTVPQDLYANNATSSAPFSSFKFWRGNISLKFQITASPTAQGCIAATFVPLTSRETVRGDLLPNFSSLSVNQTVYLFPNVNSSAEMQISFNSPFSAIDVQQHASLHPFNSLGTLILYVFNPIQLSANSSDNISVSIFVTFGDNHFRVLRTVSPTPLLVRNTRKITLQSHNNITSFKKQFTNTRNNIAQKKQEIKEKGSNIKSTVEGVIDSILPDNVVEDALETVGNFGSRLIGLGLDNPSMSNVQPPIKLRGSGPMNYTRGPEYLDALSLNPEHNPVVQTYNFGTENDESSLDFLFNKFSYLGSFQVNTTQGIGHVVASWPINPCPSRLTVARPAGDDHQVSLLQYLSIPFQLWSGAISYRFQIVSTMMQTCKLYVACNYGEYTPLASGSLDEITSQYGAFIEINQGSNIYDFTPEFLSNTPYKHVPCSNVPSEADTLGYMNVAVINPLVATNSSPIQIYINVFIAGSDTFNLFNLSLSNSIVPIDMPGVDLVTKRIKYVEKVEESDLEDIEVIEVVRPRRRIQLQSSQSQAQPTITPLSEIDMATNDDENIIAATQDMHKSVIETSQRHVDTLSNILKKYQMFESIKINSTTKHNGISIHEIDLRTLFGRTAVTAMLPPNGTFNNPPAGIFTHFERIFRQFYGSLNFKIVLNPRSDITNNCSTVVPLQVFYQPPSQNQTLGITSCLTTIQNQILLTRDMALDTNERTTYQYPTLTRLPISYASGIDKAVEFKIPYSSRFLSTLKACAISENAIYESELCDLGFLYLVHNHTAIPISEDEVAGSYTYDMFVSFGDEARLGTLYRVPFVAVNSTVTITGAIEGSPAPSSYAVDAPIANTLVRI